MAGVKKTRRGVYGLRKTANKAPNRKTIAETLKELEKEHEEEQVNENTDNASQQSVESLVEIHHWLKVTPMVPRRAHGQQKSGVTLRKEKCVNCVKRRTIIACIYESHVYEYRRETT